MSVARECGLEMNKNKSSILIYNPKQRYQTQIEGIEVVESIKSLGIKIINKKDCFTEQKKLALEKSQRMSDVLYSICNPGPVTEHSLGKLFGKAWQCLHSCMGAR